MDVIYACCCGLDIHKKTVVACLMTSVKGQPPTQEVRTFRTMTAELLLLADWLQAAGCTHVAMESTGVYWRPVYNLLEGLFTLLVVNAQHIKAVPGRKTDMKDAEWIAELLRHGLLRGSFIPAKPQRQLLYRRSCACASCLNGKSRAELPSIYAVRLSTTKSDGMWKLTILRRPNPSLFFNIMGTPNVVVHLHTWSSL